MLTPARLACLALLACPGPLPAAAEEPLGVDVELFLAVDVSRSMTPRELEIQRRGYAEALVSEDVVRALGSGPAGRIALTYVEWAGSDSHTVVVDWTVVSDRAGAEAVAARLTAQDSTAMRRTSISGAIDHAAASLAANDYAGLRQVIDISGDGPNNQGRPVTEARDAALARGIVINGLPLMTREGMGSQWNLDDLDAYYRHCVIGGPGAFLVPVTDWDEFAQAVRLKLVLDLVGLPPGAWPAGDPRPVRRAAAEGYDCLIGEKIWQRIQGDWN